jgi:hypothetical protein
MSLHHFGDPCVHCGIAHDDVPSGPCEGDSSKAVPMAYRRLGVRWDHVERFLIQMSSGEFIDRYEHVEMGLPFGYLKDVRYDKNLQRSPSSGSASHE